MKPAPRRPRRAGLAIAMAALLGLADTLAAQDRPLDSPAPAIQEPLPPAVSLGELVQHLLARNPDLTAARSLVEVASARRARAGTLPRPELTLGGATHLRGENTIDGRVQEFFLEQPLLIHGQRGARGRTADLEILRTEADVRATTAGLLREVRETFVALLAHQHRVDVLETLQGDLKRTQRIITGRAEAGLKSRYDLLRIRIGIVEIENAIRAEEAAREDTAGLLGGLVGEPGWRPRAIGEFAPQGPSDRSGLDWESARARLPAVRAASGAFDVAESAADRARRDARPVPVLGAGAVRTTDPAGWHGLLTLSVDLPFLDPPRKAVREARAEAATARLALAAAEVAARAELERSLRLLDNREATLAHFEDEVFRELPALREMSEAAYIEGQIGIVELMDAFTTLVDAKLNHAALIEAVMLAEVRVLAAAGLDGH